MKYSTLHNILSIRSYEIVEGKTPTRPKLKAFFEEKTFPQDVNNWRFGFLNYDDSVKNRTTTDFFAEVTLNIPGFKIANNEVKRMSVPQKRLEMITVAFHKNGRLEIVGSRPYTSNLLFSLMKNKFDITVKPAKNSEPTLAKLYESSFMIRRVMAMAKMDGQPVYVGLRSGKQLQDDTMTTYLKKQPNLLSIGGQIQLASGRTLSYASNKSGINLLYNPPKNRIGWQEVSEFMDNYVYNGHADATS